jgi:hypothetical protein
MIPPEVWREFGNKFLWLQTENLTSGLLAAALRMVVDAVKPKLSLWRARKVVC